tara:strand:+ start:412 stop:678 length:267 start_codon:yes stop_codon:yes gene_type:complete
MFEQQYAMTMLLIMTVTNVFLGIVMVAGFIPIEYGMSLAFFAMCGMIWKCKVDLMGNVRLWENPKQYRDRMDTRILRGRFDKENDELS